ncbi:SAM-dependent methyltransferase [Desulfurobacterium pacificum]|uniref:SAM-dependent methyltransferase n=1 Tax=Desulfurobacterium pacificum TaxID=240166 RepID=A0ABY1NSJ8_9BACT|nr:class I SAM-dependent rRNA methyltransferase [Desulfurobacterium pacificum]SMP15823.1 SAM-dependent methyltransferase [Desulfurobacterium pacificum]
MLQVSIKRGREKRIRGFHPWVYKNDILSFSRKPKPGELCVVRDYKGAFLAKGYINPDSYIAIRILTYKKDEEIDLEFFKKRIREAFEYRKSLIPEDTTAFRLVHSEGDYLPGLIVDSYDGYLVIQVTTLGMEVLKPFVVKALVEEVKPKGIYEKSTVPTRQLEGLPLVEQTLYGDIPERVVIKENGIKFNVQIIGGQKTGYFLDQRENKLLFAREFVKEGDRVLDAFCHLGGFGIHAAVIGKAGEVVAVDSSQLALDLAKENAELNGVGDRFKFVKGDAFKVLKEMQLSGEKFDSIVIDPPAFAKSKTVVEQAKRGYKELFLRGLKMLKPGGRIVVCSCSHHITPPILEEILLSAAYDTRTPLRVLYTTYQSKDHPFVLQIPESRYLKCIFAKSFEWQV